MKLNNKEEIRWVLTNDQGKQVSPLLYLDKSIEDLERVKGVLLAAKEALDAVSQALTHLPKPEPRTPTSWCIQGKQGYFHGTTTDGVNCKTVSTRGAPLTWKKKHIASKWIAEARLIDPTCKVTPRTY